MDYNSRGEIRLSNFEKKKKNFGIDFENGENLHFLGEYYLAEKGGLFSPSSRCQVGRALVGGGLSGIPSSDDTLKNSLDICSKQIHLREYSYLGQFSWLRKPLPVASGSY